MSETKQPKSDRGPTAGKTPDGHTRCKVLAVSSRGGHWIELLRLRPAFAGLDVVFVTTEPEYRSMVEGEKFYRILDATRYQKLRLLRMVMQLFWILIKERPTAIVTTGAAPGYFAIRIGKLLGAKTLWVDSIANAEELSLSGQLALKHAHTLLTQWDHLAGAGGIGYQGAVI